MARDHATSFMHEFHAEPGSVQAAFLRRAMAAIERIADTAPPKTLTAALAASTDVGSLAQLLSRSEVVGSAVTDLDPLAPALARNVEHRERLLALAGGGSWTATRRNHAAGRRQEAACEHIAGRAARKRLAVSHLPVRRR